ncbi:MAG: methyl-accepting chemotaxis protein [Thaumarchaeota archaeon]|nr:methyl-accepting chemotaxis protein [Nitrososphaerota archaeon]MDE1866572.1 methyl-accepting chemotaxis protein [Nitrososphaerota archaeon]
MLFVVMSGLLSQAYAILAPLELYTDSQVYSEGQPLLAYGKTALSNETIILRLFAPDGTIKQFNQITSDRNGDFNQILIRWPNATTNYPYGTYSVEAIDQKEQGFSQKVDVAFASSSSLISAPIKRTVIISVYAPQTAAVNQTFRVFVQITSDGLLVPGDPSKLLAGSHVHLPNGNVTILTNSFTTLHQGLYYVDFTPTQEGTYVFHMTALSQGTESNGSVATLVLKQSIEGISDQIIRLNSVLDTTSNELDKMKAEVQGFGYVLNTSQNSIAQANENMNKSVTSMSTSVQNLEAASGQFNSLFLPVVALIAVIIALQITILARRR